MSNSKSKRLISLVSASALALAGLVGVSTPANAAAALTIEPAEGSGFTFVQGSSPKFVIAGNSDFIASNGTQLRMQIRNITHQGNSLSSIKINDVALDSDFKNGTANAIAFATASSTPSDDTDPALATDSAQQDTASGTKSVFGLGVTSSSFSVVDAVSAMTAPFTFQMSHYGVDALADGVTNVFELTAFADADNDGAVDSGELSVVQNVTFISEEDVTTTVSVTPANDGDTSLDVDLTANVNLAYGIDTDQLGVYVTDGSSAATISNESRSGILSTGDTGFTLNTAKTRYDLTVTPSGIDSSDTTTDLFTVQGVFDPNGATVAATDVVGNVVTVRPGAVTVSGNESVATVVRSANAIATTTNDNADMGADVRKNTEFQVMADFENGSGANQVGKAVTWTVSASPLLSASKTVTINGTTYSTDASLAAASVAASTNASGRVFLTLNTAGFAAGETLTITATADGVAENLVATARTASYTGEFVDGTIAADTGYGKTITIGGSYTATVAVSDQWGMAPANGVQSVAFTRAVSAARTTAAVWTYNAPVVGGFASATIVDNGAGAGSDTVTATLSGTGASSSDNTDTFVLTYATAAASTVTTVELTDNQGTGDSNVRLDADALPAWHYALTAAADEPEADTANFVDGDTTGTSDTLLAISGTAQNAAGAGVAGRMVTLSAQGITFEYTDGANNEIYARDTITVPTTSGGAFSVNAYSDGKGGATVITATVDAVSDTTTVTFDAGTATGMNLEVPATAAQGRAVDIIATLTDVAGDPVSGVSVSFKATGVGYLSNLSGTTDASGEVVVKLITQNGETGDATITATATLDGVSTAVAKTVTVGQSAASEEQKVNAGSFKGYVAVYAKGYAGDRLSFKAGNDWNVTESLASDFERVVEFTGAGYTISVPIYINRVLVDTIVVTTK